LTKKKDPSEYKPRGRKPHPQSTAIEVQSRVNIIFEMLVAGASRSQVLQFAAKEDPENGKHAWGLSDRAIDDYIAKANALFSAQSKTERDLEIGKILTRYNSIYRKCIAAKDMRGALAAQQAVARLLGLDAPAKIDMTNFVTIEDVMNREKLVMNMLKDAIRVEADPETAKRIVGYIEARCIAKRD